MSSIISTSAYVCVCFFLSPCRFKGLRTVRNDPDCLWLDNHYRSSDCGGVPSIELPMLWLRPPSIMINSCTQHASNTLLNLCAYHSVHSFWDTYVHMPCQGGSVIKSEIWRYV